MTTVRCVECGLVQWLLPSSGACRRCRAPLGFSVIEIPLSTKDALRNNLNLQHFGSALRSIRLKRGTSQARVAELALTGRSLISRIERHEGTPNLSTVLRVLRALGVESLYMRIDNKAP